MEYLLKSEFAHVGVEIDYGARGPRLKISDVRTKAAIYLDPLELECLAWCDHKDLARFLNPSLTRWREEDDVYLLDPTSH